MGHVTNSSLELLPSTIAEKIPEDQFDMWLQAENVSFANPPAARTPPMDVEKLHQPTKRMETDKRSSRLLGQKDVTLCPFPDTNRLEKNTP